MSWVGFSCSVGCVLTASIAVAQVADPQPDKEALISKIIADLGSDDVTLRIDGERRLIEASSISLRDIESAARGRKLTLEQRRRLASAAYVRFCSEPRAGMGIQSGFDQGERGIVLMNVVRGFPASEVLRVGDRLLSVDGHNLVDITTMRPVVVSRDPGDEVPVVVVRGGNTLTLRVKLGRFADLNQRDRFMLTPEILDEAWAFRCSAFADPDDKDGPPPIESGLPASAWQPVGTQDVAMDFNDGGDPNLDPNTKFDAARLRNFDARDTALVAAGEARGAGSQGRWSAQQAGAPNLRLVPNQGRAELDRQRALERAAFLQQRGILRLELERAQEQLATAKDNRRRQLESRIGVLRQQIEQLNQMIDMRPAQP